MIDPHNIGHARCNAAEITKSSNFPLASARTSASVFSASVTP
jgi:hypothetical protein